MDKIFIRDLLIRGIIGINPNERIERQDIVVNVVMWTDVMDSAASDDVSLSINYKEVADQIITHVETNKPLSIEKLAVDLAQLILDQFGADRVKMRVEKPSALPFAQSVGVEIERHRL